MMTQRRDGVPTWVAAARGELRAGEPMARHTSWRVGGQADWFYRPADLDALRDFLSALPIDVPLTWVGLGSNLLVRDGGIRGVVVSPRPAFTGFADAGSGHVLEVGAGVACARIARHCAKHGVGPAAFFAGIPGTLGGALAMNAGAWGHETFEVVERVRTIDRKGTLRHRARADYDVAYRHVAGVEHDIANEWFVDARLTFTTLVEAEDVRSLLVRRKQTQPLGQPSCGSVFRNPPGDHAARLIEHCGLKGRQRGGAQVSTKHANFIINRGNARASDIERLIEEVIATVALKTGVSLRPEVRVVGEASDG